MRYKATFIAGFAAGFLAGARSGRGAYDKIVSAGQKVASHPKVQQATSAAQAKATEAAKSAAAKAPDYAKSAAKTATEQVPKYVASAKQAAQSKLPSSLGGTSGSGDAAAGDVAPDGTLVYPVDGAAPSVNGIHYSPDTP